MTHGYENLTKFRVVLQHETGTQVLTDNIDEWEEALREADALAPYYGDGQLLFIEQYNPDYYNVTSEYFH